MLKPHNFSPMAALLLLIPCPVFAEDYHTGVGRLEPQFKIPEGPPREITEDQLRDLPLSDPKLRVAYFWLIRGAMGSNEVTDVRHPAVLAALRDVKKRGDATTPLWLDIMAKNQDTSLEYRIPILIGQVGTIKMGPYVDYFRKMIQSRGDTVNGTLFGVAIDTFYEYGNSMDVQLALELAKKRPFLGDYVQTALDNERRRKTSPRTTPSSTGPSPEPAQARDSKVSEKAPTTNPVVSKHPQEPASSATWLVTTAVLIAAGISLFWFLLKKRK